jgi:hypothetical protein
VFTAGAVLSLTLAVAANTTIFSLVDSILLRPLPVADEEELVSLHARSEDGSSFHSFSYLDYQDIRQVDAFSEVVAYDLTPMAWSVGEQAEVVQGYVVSHNYFDALGIDALLGRTFSADEGSVPGRDAVAVISHDLWTRRFAGDPAVLGSEIQLNSSPFTIIGVAPQGFAGPFHGLSAHVWAPLMMREQLHVGEDLQTRNHVGLELIARMKPGIGRDRAQAAMDLAFERIESRTAEEWGIAGVDIADDRGLVRGDPAQGCGLPSGRGELRAGSGCADWRCAGHGSAHAFHCIHGIEGSRSAHLRARGEASAGAEVAEADHPGDGRQGRDRRGRDGGPGSGGRRDRVFGVRIPGSEVFGVFARDRRGLGVRRGAGEGR